MVLCFVFDFAVNKSKDTKPELYIKGFFAKI